MDAKQALSNANTASTLKEVIQAITAALKLHGFSGFWFQGVPHCAYENYHFPKETNLFSQASLRKPNASVASSPVVAELQRFYLSQVAANDFNFGFSLDTSKSYMYRLSCDKGDKASLLFSKHHIQTVLSWPVTCHSNRHWAGRFILLSHLSDSDILLTGLSATLKEAQNKLFECNKPLFNPFLQSSLLKDNARDILLMVANGLQNDEISTQLPISIRGVEYHMESMRKKFGATNRANLIHLAHQYELI
ncbi:helix-turn-helix transcriptional regulator [Shewanella sp. JNE10-2]|uniref:helix-turn-helix transcriptional regulator n=1 Tax=unclassified Shewanella TaxID=196818 RepID=UPI002005A4F0|nr:MULTISPECIES: helix-turn-helix transcriptional regulator [unclassified Shewanella]MCK7630492.1 helix-turn-helix transcriptional regulator [Shewanella sp. JNE9-1]MCK7645659.1 helix-turn-helix transcriptional regulator [Shewanella sp. JNE3-1]MCK7653742.1 helix-turn-helix transcriptional regulator [Shewanella sp. JNE4-1]UPO28263.1 helix-turn-helix transcriptional regulator [Shewanella sp. JNE10-2]UPO35472.1 helix-turn-helix transcriptional regulator [Shewanella sp. JNE7]